MNRKVFTVSKPRYVILIPFIAWILLSIWAIYMVAFPPYGCTAKVQDVNSPPSSSSSWNTAYFGMMALWLFGNMLYKLYHKIPIPVELKVFLPFFLGGSLMTLERYSNFGNIPFYVAIILVDILPITTIIVLLQGKRFGFLTLYHKEVQIR